MTSVYEQWEPLGDDLPQRCIGLVPFTPWQGLHFGEPIQSWPEWSVRRNGRRYAVAHDSIIESDDEDRAWDYSIVTEFVETFDSAALAAIDMLARPLAPRHEI